MAARIRGLGITSQDMEASRLVFVFVKDSKPRRKVAIPVPDTYTWDQFLSQVKAKLKLAGIGEIYFSATGVKVTSVSQLQDIDELCVVEGPAEVLTNGNGAAGGLQRAPSPLDGVVSPTSSLQQRQQSIPQDRHKPVLSTDGLMASTSAASGLGDESDHKYARRAHPLKRSLQRLFPNLFAPGLPVTNRDALDASADGSTLSSKPSRRRRVKRSPYNLRNLLLVLFTMCCVAMMLYLFIWVSSSPAMMSAGMGHKPAAAGSAGDAAAAAGTGAGAGGSQQPGASLAAALHGGAGAGGSVVQPQHPDAAAAGAVPVVAKQPASVVGAVTGAGAGSLAAAAGQEAAAASLRAAEAAGRAAAAAMH